MEHRRPDELLADDCDALLLVTDLRVRFRTAGAIGRAVNGVNLAVRRDETLAIVGTLGAVKRYCAVDPAALAYSRYRSRQCVRCGAARATVIEFQITGRLTSVTAS